jgi:hypothetical protein
MLLLYLPLILFEAVLAMPPWTVPAAKPKKIRVID